MFKCSLCILGIDPSEVMLWISGCPIIGGVNFDHMVKAVLSEVPPFELRRKERTEFVRQMRQ